MTRKINKVSEAKLYSLSFPLLIILIAGMVFLLFGQKHLPSMQAQAADGIYWGAWVGSEVNVAGNETAFETAVGKKRSIRHWYWSVSPISTSSENFTTWASSMPADTILMLSWVPSPQDSTLDNINNGLHDAYINEWALALKNYNKPVWLRPMWEDNGNWYWWKSGIDSDTAKKEKYKDAFQRVVTIFREAGATKVSFVWSPNVSGGVSNPTLSYPGDNYVDWIGLDGYPYSGGKGDFTATFKSDYDIFSTYGKPLMIAETSINLDSDSEKASYINNLLGNELPTNFPNIRAFVWFNEPGWGNLLQSDSPQTLEAFKTKIANPYYIDSVDLSSLPIPSHDPIPDPVLGNGTGLFGQYYSDKNLTKLVLAQTDPVISFNWLGGSPNPLLPKDNFSVRWTGTVLAATTGTYTFYTKTDDGVRLWINNQPLIDKWKVQNSTEYSADINLTAGEQYAIKMEYFEGWGNSMAQLSWQGPQVGKQIIPRSQLYSDTVPSPTVSPSPTSTPTPAPTGTPDPVISPPENGLTVAYFTNKTLTGTASLTRIDPQIYFNWGLNSPDPVVPVNNFSARWTGNLETPVGSTGQYTFYTKSDDGIRVWVNNIQVIQSWVDQTGNIERFGVTNLEGGQTYPIKVEYYDGWGNAFIELRWSGPEITKDLIPEADLTH